MVLIYVAGPLRAPNPWLVEQNIRRAETLAFEVWKTGAVPVVPHSMWRHSDRTVPDDIVLEAAKALLRKCEAMVVAEGWQQSAGTKAEVIEAHANGIPIFDLANLRTWLRGKGLVPVDHRFIGMDLSLAGRVG